jgi:hypothetical protein
VECVSYVALAYLLLRYLSFLSDWSHSFSEEVGFAESAEYLWDSRYTNDDQEKREGESPTGSSGGFLFLEIYQLRNRHFWSEQWGAPQPNPMRCVSRSRALWGRFDELDVYV